MFKRVQIIDPFHKWRLLFHSFVFMLIRHTALILKQIFFWNLLVVARLERLISIKKNKNILFDDHYERVYCYFIPVENKNPIFIPEQRKIRLNDILKIIRSSTKYELLLVFFFVVVVLFRSPFVSVLVVIGRPGIM